MSCKPLIPIGRVLNIVDNHMLLEDPKEGTEIRPLCEKLKALLEKTAQYDKEPPSDVVTKALCETNQLADSGVTVQPSLAAEDLLTHHQAMPDYVKHLFMFGQRRTAPDPLFCNFRHYPLTKGSVPP